MLSVADFESWSVLLQAVLAAGAAAMSWRGAVLAGDRKRKHALAWGMASAVTFILALLIGAIGHLEESAFPTRHDFG